MTILPTNFNWTFAVYENFANCDWTNAFVDSAFTNLSRQLCHANFVTSIMSSLFCHANFWLYISADYG